MDPTSATRLADALTSFVRTARLAATHDGLRSLAGTQAGILRRVAHGDRRLSDLARELLVDTSVVSRAVADLTKSGYLTRATDPADARACRLRATATGRRELDRHTTALQDLVGQAFAELSADELEQAVSVLQRLEGLLHRIPQIHDVTASSRPCPPHTHGPAESDASARPSLTPASAIPTLEPSA